MFSFRAHDIFCIRGRGMVLTGRVEDGRLFIGARAILRTPSVSVPSKIVAVERNRKIVPFARAGEEVALMFRGVDPAELIGGIEIVEAKRDFLSRWKVVDLQI